MPFSEAMAEAVDLSVASLPGEDEGRCRMPQIRGEPWLDYQNATRVDVSRHAPDRRREPVESLENADRAEQASDDVVRAAEIELKHIGADIVARRILAHRGKQIVFIDVDAIKRIMLFEKSGMLASAARNIEDSARAWRQRADQVTQTSAFTSIILVAVDRVVELSAFDESLIKWLHLDSIFDAE